MVWIVRDVSKVKSEKRVKSVERIVLLNINCSSAYLVLQMT